MPLPHRAEALSDAFVCLSRTSGLTREQRGPERLKLAEVANHFQGQKVKGQLVDVLMMPEQVSPGEYIRKYCQLAGAEAYCVTTCTACFTMSLKRDLNLSYAAVRSNFFSERIVYIWI